MFTSVLYIPQNFTFDSRWLAEHTWIRKQSLILIFDGSPPTRRLPKEVVVIHHKHNKGIIASVRQLIRRIRTPNLLLVQAGTSISEDQIQDMTLRKDAATGFGCSNHLSDACLFLLLKDIAPLWSKIHPMLQWGYGARLTALMQQQGLSWSAITPSNTSFPSAQRYVLQQMANILSHELESSHSTLEVQEAWYTPQTEKVSIIVLVWNRLDVTTACIKSILRNTNHPFELIIVDNGSTEPVGAWVEEHLHGLNHIIYHRNDTNQGFPQGCNDGMARATGEHIVLLNNDTIVTTYWLCRQVAAFADPQIGIVGPVSRETSAFQNIFTILPIEQLPLNLRKRKPFSSMKELLHFSFLYTAMMLGQKQEEMFVAGLCMLIRKEVWQKIGGMDACYGFGNCEDTDYCIRTKRLGYRVEVLRDIFIDHIRSSTFSNSTIPYDILIFQNILHSHYKHFSVARAQQIIESCTSTRELLDSRTLWKDTRTFDPKQDVIPFQLHQNLRQHNPNPPFEPPKTILCLPPIGHVQWIDQLASLVSDAWNIIIYLDPPIPEQHRQIEVLLENASLSRDNIYLWKEYVPTNQRGLLYSCVSGVLKIERFDWFRIHREAQVLQLPIYTTLPS